jgi:hypothetical protein
MKQKLEITKGQKYGKLTVIEEIEPNISRSGQKERKLLCSCECGNQKIIRLVNLRNGKTKSCGCLHKEVVSRKMTETLTKHGLSRHYLYPTWKNMIHRCQNENHKQYKDYGDRGIKVCDRWVQSFNNFLQDMGERPEGMSIDRIDNNNNYEPSNCRWATPLQQTHNRRTTKKLYNEITGVSERE